MGRLIDEDDVLKALCRELCHPGAICPDGYCEEMREKLKDVPTAHPEPLTIEISGNIPKDEIIDRIIDELGKRKPSGIGYIRRKTDAVD